jgi:hypothetical protein
MVVALPLGNVSSASLKVLGRIFVMALQCHQVIWAAFSFRHVATWAPALLHFSSVRGDVFGLMPM